jgi:hypothetical protein
MTQMGCKWVASRVQMEIHICIFAVMWGSTKFCKQEIKLIGLTPYFFLKVCILSFFAFSPALPQKFPIAVMNFRTTCISLLAVFADLREFLCENKKMPKVLIEYSFASCFCGCYYGFINSRKLLAKFCHLIITVHFSSFW